MKKVLYLLLLLPISLLSQERANKTWDDTMSKSKYIIRYDKGEERYEFIAEKYQREGEYGTLAKGSADRIRQVIAQMDAALQSRDPDQLFALGRYKYSYVKLKMNDLLEVETLKIEDLIADDQRKLPVYMMSFGTLEGIKEFVAELE